MNTFVSFLQSFEWEGFQQSVGRKTWRIEGALVIRHPLPLGFNYLYCPRPGFSDKRQATSDKFFHEAEKIARDQKSIFLKIDPVRNFQFSISNFQFSNSLQPQKTAIIDLLQSDEQLLAAMHPKTRYNIRLAEKKGVSVTFQVPSSKFQVQQFFELLQRTAGRDGFRTHPREYYEKMLAIRSDDFSNELFFASYQDKILAAALVNFYTPPMTATYLHGGSSHEHREAMASHLLHWRSIQEAKKRGFRCYDFWGIDEQKWPGVTRFKKGFGGERREYPASIDIVYRPAEYAAYRMFRRLFHG